MAGKKYNPLIKFGIDLVASNADITAIVNGLILPQGTTTGNQYIGNDANWKVEGTTSNFKLKFKSNSILNATSAGALTLKPLGASGLWFHPTANYLFSPSGSRVGIQVSNYTTVLDNSNGTDAIHIDNGTNWLNYPSGNLAISMNTALNYFQIKNTLQNNLLYGSQYVTSLHSPLGYAGVVIYDGQTSITDQNSTPVVSVLSDGSLILSATIENTKANLSYVLTEGTDGYIKKTIFSTILDGTVKTADTNASGFSFVLNENDLISNSATKLPTQASVKAYVDNLVSLGVVVKGGYDAATDTPHLDSAPLATIKKGDMYFVTADGNFYTQAVKIGDTLIAKVDSAAALTDWVVLEKNLDTATENTQGIAALATQAEVNAGTVTDKIVTPATLASFTPPATAKEFIALKFNDTSANKSFTITTTNNVMSLYLVEKSAGFGFSANQITTPNKTAKYNVSILITYADTASTTRIITGGVRLSSGTEVLVSQTTSSSGSSTNPTQYRLVKHRQEFTAAQILEVFARTTSNYTFQIAPQEIISEIFIEEV